MATNNSRGNYYKKRTKEWFEKKGYTCENLEVVYQIKTPSGRFFKKHDPLGSDIVCWNQEEFLLVNSKSTITGSVSVEKSRGKSDYKKYTFPPFIKKVLLIWQPRQEPTYLEVE